MKGRMHCTWGKCGAWLISLVFHPIFIPFYTLLLYFEISRYFFYDTVRILRLLFMSAVVVPLLLLILLNRFKVLQSALPHDCRTRAFFSILLAVIYALLARTLQPLTGLRQLAVYFAGISISLLMAAVLYGFRKKISLHALAVGGTLFFFLRWSYAYSVNILHIIVLVIALGTLVLISRLILNAHTPVQLAWGFFVGMAGQLAALWLIRWF